MTVINRVQLKSGVLHVESHGDPLGHLILCVHGLSANCRSFDRFVPALVRAGRQVVTLDLRGRGRSEITPSGTYGWDSHISDLLEIADFAGADSFDVIGHSMGGFIGMALAARYPRRCDRLVLIDAAGVPEPSSLVAISKSVGRLGRRYPSVTAMLSHMRSVGIIAPWDEFWDNYFQWELRPDGDAVRVRTDPAAVAEDNASASAYDVYSLWPRLRCPVLLVRASKPMEPGGGLVVSQVDGDRFAAEVHNAEVIDVDADHYSILTCPSAISAVARFVDPDQSG